MATTSIGDKVLQFMAYLAQVLFVVATACQAYKCHKEGHASGISHGMLWLLAVGFSIMIVYTVERLNADLVLLFGYGGQAIFFSVIGKYKYFPRK